MAVRHGYGKVAGIDALAFAYDTGDTKNSYRGEPTENLFPYPQFTNHTNNVVGAASITKKDFGDGKIGIEIIQGSTSDIVSFSMESLASAVSGATYTWSSYVHASKTSAVVKAQVTIRVDGVRYWLTNSNTWTTSVTECSHLFAPTVADQWHRVDTQFTMPTGTLTEFQLGGWYRNNSDYTLKLANAQLEIKSHPTQFLTGTRSSTQGLLDLTGNSTIDISPTSFNSNAEIEYDGSNDYIYVGSKTWSFPSGATVEQIIKPLTLDRQQGFFTLNNDAGSYINFWMPTNNTMRWEVIGTVSQGYSTINSTTAFQTGQYYHVVGTFNGTTTNLYINGVEENSQTMTNQPTSMTAQMDIGRYGGSYPSSAQIPVTKFYTRPLTAAEVKNNFNLYKSRYGM